MTKVVHCKKEPYSRYIGRIKNTPRHFGNPFSHKDDSLAEVKVETIEQSVSCFESWLLGETHQDVEPIRREWILAHLDFLKDQTLGCWCKGNKDNPKNLCHGDILAKMADKI